MNIKEFRQKYPEYNDIDDDTLAKSLHKKYYSDMDFKEFSNKFIGSSSSKSMIPGMFPSFDAPPAEIPTSGAGFAADLAGGLIEQPANILGQGLGLIPGGLNAAGHAIAAAAAGVDVGEAAKEGFHSGMEAIRTITGTKPETYSGQRFDETMGDLFTAFIKGVGGTYEKVKRAFDLGLLEDLKKIDPEKYKAVEDRVRTRSGEARSLIEGGTEATAYISGARAVGKQAAQAGRIIQDLRDSRKSTGIRKVPPTPAPETPRVWEQVEQAHAPIEGTVRAPQYGMGEVPSYIERDMFGQPEIRPPVVERPQFGPENLADTAAIDAQIPRSPFTLQETPAQLRKMNESEFTAPDPNRPFYGDNRAGMLRELPDRGDVARAAAAQDSARLLDFDFEGQGLDPKTRAKSQKPIPYQEVPVERPLRPGDPIPFTKERIPDPTTTPDGFEQLRRPEPIETVPFEQLGAPEFAGTTGWQRADPRVAEAIAGDSYLKGMQNRLAKMEENLKGIGEMQGEVHQRYGQRRVEGGSGQQIGRELVSYTKSMKAVERDIAALKEKIDSRVKMHEERVRKQPKYEKTIDPFKKGPGRRQRGAINPEVFREGFQKAKDLAGKGLRLMAYATRDEYGPVFRVSARKADGTEVGSADFIPTRGGLKRLPERDLLSALTEVDPQYQRKGIATEMYKFAHELGNDVVPSSAQTMEGKAMWEGFKAKNVPLSQRGAVNFGVSEKIAGMIDKLRAKRDSKSPEKTLAQVRTDREGLLRSAEGEARSPEQALKEIDPKNIKDLPDSPFEQTLEALSNAQMVYNNTKNPWVKYISDFATNAKQQAVLLHETLTQGISFGKGLLPNKIIDKSSPAGIWNSISAFERRVLTDIINKYNGVEWPSRDTIIAMGGKEKHAKMLERLQEPLNNLWSRINDELKAQGKAPMPFRPFYFMKAQGFGPWLVRIKDANDVTVAFHRMETKFGANQMAKELRKKFEGEGYKIETDVADRATKGNKYNISTTMLEQIYQALEKSDPRREAITSAIADIKSKGGFAAHRARRGDVKGMELSPKNFWDTYDAYIKDGSNYIANLQIGKALKDISTMTEIPPRLRSWSMDYLNVARGGADPGAVVRGIEAFADGIVRIATLGQTGPGIARKMTTELGRGFMTSVLFFGNVPFLVGQALQSTAFAPSILSNYKFNMGYSKGSITGSFVEGTLRMLTKDKEFVEMASFLAARGKLDPTLVSEISVFSRVGSGLTSNAPIMDKGLAALRKTGDIVSGTFIGRNLESVGRMHAAAIGLDFLKKNGLEGKELKLAVERFVDDTMGNYSMSDRPGLISRTGFVGEAMKPLSTFKNWFLGTTAIMIKEAGQGIGKGQFSRAVPLANLWLSTAIFGGLTGSIAFKELDMLFDFLKGQEWFQDTMKKAGFNVNSASPSLTEIILRSPIPDAGKLGVVTGATQLIDPRGIHIAGSMTAPEVMPSVAQWGWKGLAPGLGFGVDLMDALSTLGMDRTGLKTATTEEKRKAWKQMLPGIGDKILNNLDSELPTDAMNPFEGTLGFGDKPVPGGARGYGTVRRDGFETMASIIGAGTIPEVKEKAARRDIKEMSQDLTAKKARLVDLGIDAIQSGNTDQLAQHMQKAIELGFPDYVEALQAAMMKRATTEKERSRFSTPQQVRQWEYVEEAGR